MPISAHIIRVVAPKSPTFDSIVFRTGKKYSSIKADQDKSPPEEPPHTIFNVPINKL